MKGRKTIAALIALAMVLSLTACKEDKGSDSNSDTSSETETTTTTTKMTITTTTQDSAQTKKTSAETTTAQSAVTTTAQTTAQPKTTKQTTIQTSPQKAGEISNGDAKLAIHDLSGFSQWSMMNGSIEKDFAYAYSELYDIMLGFVPTEQMEIRINNAKKNGRRITKLNYKGKEVTAVENQFISVDKADKDKLFGGYFYYISWENDLYLCALARPGGNLFMRNNGGAYIAYAPNIDIAKWFKDNEKEYSKLSTDPKDYLFIFDALDMK